MCQAMLNTFYTLLFKDNFSAGSQNNCCPPKLNLFKVMQLVYRANSTELLQTSSRDGLSNGSH